MANITLPDLTTTTTTTTLMDPATTIIMDPATDPSVVDRLESFLYTPMGVGTLAGVAVIITSLVWLIGCCVYCCCRRRRYSDEGGVTVANRDLMFLDIGPTDSVNNGTMSSGYNTGPQPYTTSGSYNNPMERNGSQTMLHTTSLDSVISMDRYWSSRMQMLTHSLLFAIVKLVNCHSHIFVFINRSLHIQHSYCTINNNPSRTRYYIVLCYEYKIKLYMYIYIALSCSVRREIGELLCGHSTDTQCTSWRRFDHIL